jgi:hypothetical protein
MWEVNENNSGSLCRKVIISFLIIMGYKKAQFQHAFLHSIILYVLMISDGNITKNGTSGQMLFCF